MKEKCDNRNQTRIGKHIDKHLPNGLLVFVNIINDTEKRSLVLYG
jgi:hypothetical protein